MSSPAYCRFSPDVAAAMFVYRAIAKKVFWEFDSIIIQNFGGILSLFCTSTWPSDHASENQELYLFILRGYFSTRVRYLHTVTLDVVPERRTRGCPPRFRPGDRFCELSFRYLSPGREGEKCWPLHRVWYMPFIHSTQFINRNNFYIETAVFQLFPRCGTLKCALVWRLFDNCACAMTETQAHFKIQRHYFILVVIYSVGAGAYWHKWMVFTHVSAFA